MNTCGFEGARRGDYFKGEAVNMGEMEGIKKGTEGRENCESRNAIKSRGRKRSIF